MLKLTNTTIGIDQGDDVLFSDYEDGGDMWTGGGSRSRVKKVKFKEPYKVPPAVHVSLTMWDMDSATNARADVTAQKITEKGFEILFYTWADTRIARARVRWMAIGEVKGEDDWELY